MLTRREFLKSTGGLAIWFSLAPAARVLAQGGGLSGSVADYPDLDSWLRVNADGTVSVWSGKVEIGQGIHTALAQIVAEELDVDIDRIQFPAIDSNRAPNEGSTVGSLSVQRSGSALRLAAAEARALLLDMAADELGTEAAALTVSDGAIHGAEGAAGTDYWSLVGDREFNHTLTGDVSPKPWQEHTIVGQSVIRADLAPKVFGEEIYVQDMRLDGMLHARVVRSGRLATAELLEADTGSVESMEGVVAVVRDGSFLAVVAEREEQAIRAAEALRSTARWDDEVALPEDAAEWLRTTPSEAIVSEEAGSPGEVEAASRLSVDYFRPWQSHASMSPSAAVALKDDDGLTVWTHSQGIHFLQGSIAAIVGLPEDEVRCIHAQASGCYGHNGADDAGADAAVVAMHLPGRPIRMQWSRSDEFTAEPYGSAMSIHLEAGLDEAGTIVDWQHELWSCTHSTRPGGYEGAGNMLAARQVANTQPRPALRVIPLPSGGMDRNAVPIYTAPNRRIIKNVVQDMPLRVSALRGLGAYANIFAIESFIDELAALAGSDPLQFRLDHLEDERAIALLEALGDRSGWSADREHDGVHGRGIGFARYKNLSSWCGVVADVAVDSASGKISVQRVTGVVDAGQAISPDGISNQIEGGIVQGTSWTLMEEVGYEAGGTRMRDWASYPILRFSEVPEVDVEVINRPDMPPLGSGESSQGPIGAAIGNAVADAVGIRLRELPLTPERVLKALSERST